MCEWICNVCVKFSTRKAYRPGLWTIAGWLADDRTDSLIDWLTECLTNTILTHRRAGNLATYFANRMSVQNFEVAGKNLPPGESNTATLPQPYMLVRKHGCWVNFAVPTASWTVPILVSLARRRRKREPLFVETLWGQIVVHNFLQCNCQDKCHAQILWNTLFKKMFVFAKIYVWTTAVLVWVHDIRARNLKRKVYSPVISNGYRKFEWPKPKWSWPKE